MNSAPDLIHGLTDPDLSIGAKRSLADEFSREFGWRPNDFIDTLSPLTSTNFVVEQGLDNAALLSFLPAGRRVQDVRIDEQREILALSYNSLVDWHIWIDKDSIQYFYNRNYPSSHIYTQNFDSSDYSALTREVFDQATDKAPNPNIMALDGALLSTIRNWKQILRNEVGKTASNASISALFNAVILARAIEDFETRTRIPTVSRHTPLRNIVRESESSIVDILEQAISQGGDLEVSGQLFSRSALEPLARLSKENSRALIDSFYRHASVPYDYDFSVMSKRALSKIYERYTAVMQHEEAVQFSMFPAAPEDSWNKHLGGVYTPQYIASFFARYLESQVTPERFMDASIADPACGSGIFLRASMERKLLASDADLRDSAEPVLGSLFGADVDENAVAASRLSLALLYLAARGELPSDVPIRQADSLELFSPSGGFDRQFDVVMANPPFVRTELQAEDVRRAVVEHVGSLVKGKLDAYLAFVVLSIRALRPGGFGLFVVPQPLLTSDNLKPLRDWIQDQAWIRVVADLSAIPVFEANVYVALVVVQRKGGESFPAPPVALVRCNADVGAALEDFLDGKHRRTSSYSIFEAAQAALARPTWSVHAPEEASLLRKLEAMPHLGQASEVRQGVITGADSVFVVDSEAVPAAESSLYRPFLPDRLIGRFTLPAQTGTHVFYPILGDKIVSTPRLSSDFPETWAWLNLHKEKLSSRAAVAGGTLEWWQPARLRYPHVLAPKIVMPEVSLIPRFGIDQTGEWIVGHSPFIYLPEERPDEDTLLVIAALLNSSVVAWFIDLNARKYRSNYNKVGVSLMRRIPIPDLSHVQLPNIRKAIDLARTLVNSEDREFNYELALELDDLILRNMYGLSEEDIQIVRP